MRFYFHSREKNGFTADYEGMDLASLNDARREAIGGAREIIGERIRHALPIHLETITEIADEAGTIVDRVAYSDVLKVIMQEQDPAKP